MKILVVGFCKTGTKTVEKALELLGYKVSSYIRNASELYDDWKRFQNGLGTAEDLKRMFKGYDVASDTPSNIHWRIFVEAFPDIKLIFMTRPEDDWLKSILRELETEDKEIPLFYRIFSQTARRYYSFGLKIQSLEDCRKKKEEIHESMKAVFRKHNQDIIENAPRQQLLVFNLSEGWKSLCDFLQAEEPKVQFPHENKKNQWLKDVSAKDPFFLQMKYDACKNFSLLCFAVVGVLAVLVSR